MAAPGMCIGDQARFSTGRLLGIDGGKHLPARLQPSDEPAKGPGIQTRISVGRPAGRKRSSGYCPCSNWGDRDRNADTVALIRRSTVGMAAKRAVPN